MPTSRLSHMPLTNLPTPPTNSLSHRLDFQLKQEMVLCSSSGQTHGKVSCLWEKQSILRSCVYYIKRKSKDVKQESRLTAFIADWRTMDTVGLSALPAISCFVSAQQIIRLLFLFFIPSYGGHIMSTQTNTLTVNSHTHCTDLITTRVRRKSMRQRARGEAAWLTGRVVGIAAN